MSCISVNITFIKPVSLASITFIKPVVRARTYKVCAVQSGIPLHASDGALYVTEGSLLVSKI